MYNLDLNLSRKLILTPNPSFNSDPTGTGRFLKQFPRFLRSVVNSCRRQGRLTSFVRLHDGFSVRTSLGLVHLKSRGALPFDNLAFTSPTTFSRNGQHHQAFLIRLRGSELNAEFALGETSFVVPSGTMLVLNSRFHFSTGLPHCSFSSGGAAYCELNLGFSCNLLEKLSASLAALAFLAPSTGQRIEC
jgi:hypothetical protein